MALCHGCGGSCLVNGAVCMVCKGAGTNGVDLSIDKGREAAIRRELNPPPCCERIASGIWCTRAQGHQGEHKNPDAEPEYGPREATPSLWRKHRGLR
jgi:hypothetical protein